MPFQHQSPAMARHDHWATTTEARVREHIGYDPSPYADLDDAILGLYKGHHIATPFGSYRYLPSAPTRRERQILRAYGIDAAMEPAYQRWAIRYRSVAAARELLERWQAAHPDSIRSHPPADPHDPVQGGNGGYTALIAWDYMDARRRATADANGRINGA